MVDIPMAWSLSACVSLGIVLVFFQSMNVCSIKHGYLCNIIARASLAKPRKFILHVFHNLPIPSVAFEVMRSGYENDEVIQYCLPRIKPGIVRLLF